MMAFSWLLRKSRLTLAVIAMFFALAGSGCGTHPEPAKLIVQPPVSVAEKQKLPSGTPPPSNLGSSVASADNSGSSVASADNSGSSVASTDNSGPELMSMTVERPYSVKPDSGGYVGTQGFDGETYWYSADLPSSTSTIVQTGQVFGVRVDLTSKAPEDGLHIDLVLDGELQPAFDITSGKDFMVRNFRMINPGDHVFRVSYQGRSFDVNVRAFGSPFRETSAENSNSADSSGLPDCEEPLPSNAPCQDHGVITTKRDWVYAKSMLPPGLR